jgi:hypothetical protein
MRILGQGVTLRDRDFATANIAPVYSRVRRGIARLKDIIESDSMTDRYQSHFLVKRHIFSN